MSNVQCHPGEGRDPVCRVCGTIEKELDASLRWHDTVGMGYYE